MTDDAADGAFAPDQNGLDVASVLVADQKRHQGRPAWKVDQVDIVAGIVEQFVGRLLGLDQVRHDQRIILVAQGTQQVVERLFGREAIRPARLKAHALRLPTTGEIAPAGRYVHK